jgi:amino acid permease
MDSSGEKNIESTSKDVEMYAGPDVSEGEEIKRDLKSRHINMIAIAGMIVSCPLVNE